MGALKYYWRRAWQMMRWIDPRVSSKYLMQVRRMMLERYRDRPYSSSSIAIFKKLNALLVRRFGVRFIEFEVTNICNARCIFCPYPDFLKTDKKFMRMEPDTFENSLELLEELDYNLVSFTPTTGETLLHPNWAEMMTKMTRLENIDQITLYSNAIVLDEKCRKELIEVLKSEEGDKVFSLMFSVGGLDRETYKEMFLVDRFDDVVENINSLLDEMCSERLYTNVTIKLRIPDDSSFDQGRADQLFNKAQYPFANVDGGKYFEANEYMKRDEKLKYTENAPGTKACSYLLKTRVAADGGIWADGCVLSEVPDDTSLKLGHVSDPWDKIEEKRTEIIQKWELEGEIPLPCRGCSIYRNDGVDPKYLN